MWKTFAINTKNIVERKYNKNNKIVANIDGNMMMGRMNIDEYQIPLKITNVLIKHSHRENLSENNS